MRTFHRLVLVLALVPALGGGLGCYGAVATAVPYPSSRLVEVDPGVWVVADSPSAIYFTNGFYWYGYDGAWYRRMPRGGAWVRVGVAAVPRSIAFRDHRLYAHYHPARVVGHESHDGRAFREHRR